MTIEEMHKLFRTLGQQMGIQQVRGILPAEIDRFINDAIITKVRDVLAKNGILAEKSGASVERNLITPINALRTLYKENSISPSTGNTIALGNLEQYVLVYLGFSVSYNDSNRYYNCRIIEPIELENTLNDYCSKDSKEYPIICLHKNNTDNYKGVIYSGNNAIQAIKVKYIKKPVKVDGHSNSTISCDLPEYLHTEIVELAVNKFFTAVGYTTPNANK